MSSSPGLPSLAELFDGKRRLCSESSGVNPTVGPKIKTPRIRSARDVQQALQGVETPAPLRRSQTSVDGVKDGHGESCKVDERSEEVYNAPDGKKIKERSTTKRPNSTVSPHFVLVEETPSAKGSSARRKKSTKKSRNPDQSRIPKSKITKPRATAHPEKRAGVQSTKKPLEGDTVEKNINAEQKQASEVPALQGKPSEIDLGSTETVEEGLERSPTKNSSDCQIPPAEVEAAWFNLMPSELPSHSGPLDPAVETTLEGFGYVEADQPASRVSILSRSSTGEAVAKRPRLDHAISQELTIPQGVATKRGKSLKKKPQTITEKATAPFALEHHSNPSSLLNYFATPPPIIEPEQAVSAQANADEKRNLPVKKIVKAKKAKPKPKEKPKPTVRLLSPGRAVKTANDQDLLFGTSSQLAREESPTFIGDLQRAFRDSEATGSHQPPSQEMESQASIQSIASSTSSIKRSAGFRNLWSVATRDATGSLHNVETVDLVNTPQPSRSYATDVGSNGGAEAGGIMSNIPLLPPVHESRSAETVERSVSSVDPTTKSHESSHLLPRSVVEASLRNRPRSKSPVKKQTSRSKAGDSMTGSPFPEMPNYNAFSDMQLVKSITAFGFKPSKQSRKGMVELLELCWKSEHQKALRSLPSPDPIPPESANVLALDESQSKRPAKKRGRPPKPAKGATSMETETGSNAALKKPRGRPKKNAATEAPEAKACAKPARSKGPLEHDPETAAEPASKVSKETHSSPRRPRGSSKPLDTVKRSTVRAPKLSAEESTALRPIITKAVKTQPPTHDAANLSWYEKILLYDPIILEDLTDWLNEMGLSSVDCKKTITPLVVKQWCESKSICCLWRENLRGGTRARY